VKTVIIILLGLLIVPLYAFKVQNQTAPSSGNIHVIIEGIDEDVGQIGILLFEQEDGFPSDQRKALQQVLLPFEGTTLRYSFNNLPYGTYAVSVMHDANMNDKLDTNFIGIPKEGIGISNNAKGVLSAPKFRDASFVLDKSEVTKSIELNY
jgi:uncharacterized protein (DUF2141 family)